MGPYRFAAEQRARYSGDFRTAAREALAGADEQLQLRTEMLCTALQDGLFLGDVVLVRDCLASIEASEDATSLLNQAVIRTGRAGIAALEGRSDDALTDLRVGLDGFDRLGVDYFRAEAILIAVRLLGPGNAELRGLAEEARLVFERLGAKPYLTWLEDALTRSMSDSPAATVDGSRASLGAAEPH